MDIFMDLECAPDLSPGALERYVKDVRPPGQYSKPDSIAKWMAENAATIGMENWLRTALDPTCGSIYVFGFAIQDSAPVTLYRQPEESEAALLEMALNAIAAATDKPGQARSIRFIGWNHRTFDLPFLAKRCVINRITPPFKIPLHSRYNDERVLDLMTEWAGFREYAKQSDVAKALGIAGTSEVDGKDLWAFVQKEGVGAAAAKCRSDINVLMGIYRRMSPVFGI
jgi:hypothetical protein